MNGFLRQLGGELHRMFASACCDAGSARSLAPVPGSTKRRAWIPVRSTIQSWFVSTIFARSWFVTTRSGKCFPTPVIPTGCSVPVMLPPGPVPSLRTSRQIWPEASRRPTSAAEVSGRIRR